MPCDYRASRPTNLKPATINRGVAVLRSLLTCAVEDRLIPPPNPLFGFDDYTETERDLFIMTTPQERAIVAALLDIDLAVGVYAGVMGETAIRTEEGLRLTWRSIDLGARIVTVPAAIAKTKKTRHMSDFCRDLLGMLPRVTEDPHVFIRLSTLKPVKDTRGAFSKARERTKLDVYPESFRHFRITQWMLQGIDPDRAATRGSSGHPHDHALRTFRALPCISTDPRGPARGSGKFAATHVRIRFWSRTKTGPVGGRIGAVVCVGSR
jgi:integrase